MQVEANHAAGPNCPSTLEALSQHNPHYSTPDDILHLSSPRSSCHRRNKNPEPHMIIVLDDGDGGEEVELDQGYGSMSSRIRDLRAELEFERRMRRKAEALSEALAAELAEERRRSEAAEAECRARREDAEEERRMLRVAELWREERVQMKLADARAALEDKLREIDDAVAGLHAAAAAAASDNNKSSSSCCCSPNGGKSCCTSQQGQQSPGRSQHGQLHRREPAGGENPHIRRGIKGFVEFPRAVRVPPRDRGERVDLVSNLECQRAQLRVLMRHRSPATAGMGIIGAAENLVV